jgi:hypothetical protein
MIEFVNFAFRNINKVLLGPVGAIGAKGCNAGANEGVRTIDTRQSRIIQPITKVI